jgi:hypothetical protein
MSAARRGAAARLLRPLDKGSNPERRPQSALPTDQRLDFLPSDTIWAIGWDRTAYCAARRRRPTLFPDPLCPG